MQLLGALLCVLCVVQVEAELGHAFLLGAFLI